MADGNEHAVHRPLGECAHRPSGAWLAHRGTVTREAERGRPRSSVEPLLDAPVKLNVEYAKSLDLFPRSGSVDLDLIFRRFAQDAFSREIPIDRLALQMIVERHTPKATELAQQSTLLQGKAHLRATGKDHPLKKGDGLRFSAVSGEITDLRLAEDGVRFGFRGRVSGLERTAGGLQPESLMPSVLDLWLAGPVQVAVNGASGATAALVLFLTVLGIQPRSRFLKLLGAAAAAAAKPTSSVKP